METHQDQEHHELVFLESGADDSQELYCPVCGRHLVVTWPPNYKKTVLVEGNVNAIHSGGTGGLKVQAPVGTNQAVPTPPESEIKPGEFTVDRSLIPFIDWMYRVGFNSFWD